MAKMVTNKHGYVLDMDIAANYMDDEIREQMCATCLADTDQAWFAEYEAAHEAKYGEEWELSKANPVW